MAKSIVTDLVGVHVKVNCSASSPAQDGVVRGVFVDGDDEPKLLVQLEDGTLADVYAATQVVICRDYRQLPVRDKK